MGEIFSEENQWWIAGYQLEDEYFNLQDESNAIKHSGDNLNIYWERFEKYENADASGPYDETIGDQIRQELVEAHHIVVGWVSDSGEYHYATIDGGIDLDYFDMDFWIEEADKEYG